MPDFAQQMVDRSLLRQAADIYAVGADRRDKQLWRQVLAEECVIEGPGFVSEGRETCLLSLDALGQMFRGTQHRIHQQVVAIDGDRAVGETYCTADHLLRDRDAVLVWAIRYQDAWRREADNWCFTGRRLIVDSTETRPVTVGIGA